MKRTFFFITTAFVVLTACQQKNENDEANALLAEIETLYETGQYRTALDSIESLRRRFPTSVEARRKGLRLWQEASLKMAQADIALTDSALQATTAQMQDGTSGSRLPMGITRLRSSYRLGK